MNLTPILALLSIVALVEATMCAPDSVFATLFEPNRRPFIKAEQARFRGISCLRRLTHRTQGAASQFCSTHVFCGSYNNRQMKSWLKDKKEPLWYENSKQCLDDHRPDPETCKCNCGPYREACLPLDLVRQHIPGFGSRAAARTGSELDSGLGFGSGRDTGSGTGTGSDTGTGTGRSSGSDSGSGSDSSSSSGSDSGSVSGSGLPLYKWYNADSYVHEKCLNWHAGPVTFEQAAKDCGSRRLCDSFDKVWQRPRLLSIQDDHPLPANGWECLKRFNLNPNLGNVPA